MLTLTPDELRAHLNRIGLVVLERAHYTAVCEGRYARPLEAVQNDRPRVERVT